MEKRYRKRGTTPMVPWTEGVNTSDVSISESDRQAGSPKEGDMIAHNDNDPTDRWLVARAYFEKNYDPA